MFRGFHGVSKEISGMKWIEEVYVFPSRPLNRMWRDYYFLFLFKG